MLSVAERLAKLRKRGKKVYGVDVIKELKKRGIRVSSADFSRFTTGASDPPKSDSVLSETDKILTGWEEAE